jgi:hypothetical protein
MMIASGRIAKDPVKYGFSDNAIGASD